MRQRVIPVLAPMVRPRPVGDTFRETKSRGLVVLNSPHLNKGTAFTAAERHALGLTGLLPAEISTLVSQVERAYIQYERLPDALSKNIYLTTLQDRNEMLFYRLFTDHLREMIPIVNDLTVGVAIQRYQHECRRPRGVYLSIDQPEAIEEAFTNFAGGGGGIDLILATDAEQILGIGDWGVGGIEVPIGKLATYTAAAGIDPARVIPVMLDVGTNRQSLLDDPMYVGNRHPRVRGQEYDAFLDAYVKAATRLFPHALLQWTDFEPGNARRIMARYRNRICTFNEGLQGLGAVTLAAAISAVRVCGTPLRSQRIVIFGSGTAAIGIADQIRDAMMSEGLSAEDAARRFWLVDRNRLLTDDMTEGLNAYQAPYARPHEEVRDWKRGANAASVGFAEVTRRVRPTMLIGASATPGIFTEAIVREMASHVERPIVFALSHPALSHPPARPEATPADLIRWTDGRALVACGGTFAPVTHKGVTYVIAHVNNAMLYPGLCLGAVVSRAARISNGMIAAAANAVSSLVAVRQPGASLLPHIEDLRSVAVTVAVAVAEAAHTAGLAKVKFHDIVQQVQDAMWQPEYRRIKAS